MPILGNNPVFAPGLLEGPTARLKSHLYVASPVSSFDEQPTCSRRTRPPTPTTPSLGVRRGHAAWPRVMNQILDEACDNGDLTRAGVPRPRRR